MTALDTALKLVANVCSVPACNDRTVARGYCNKHYLRWRHGGDPEISRRTTPEMNLQDRLNFYGWELVVGPLVTPCWIFNKKPTSKGYCTLTMNGQSIFAHRAAYSLWVGPIPEKLLVRHKCDRPKCINPGHLEVGTHADNYNDMLVRGRFKGSGKKKIPDSEIPNIREFRRNGATLESIALIYDVSFSNISYICSNKSRKGV